MLLININKNSKTPLYKQVFEALKQKIDNHALQYGDRLPATRAFAKQLGVNRSTIYKAYEELWALGYIDSKPGSYSTVRKPPEIAKKQEVYSISQIDWENRTNKPGNRLIKELKSHELSEISEDVIDFISLAPDPELLSTREYRKCLNQVVNEKGARLLQYGDPMGYSPLREYLSQRMRRHGIYADVDEIVITNGIQNGLDLIMKLFKREGLQILVEEPSYSAVLPLFGYYDAEILSIPMNRTGIDLDVLQKILEKNNPAFLYTIPNFHNPYGVTTSQEHRERLLSIAEHYNLLVLEDGFEEEMKYFGKAVMPVKSMDKNQRVLYFGTFSKVLFPGLRIGWIVGDRELVSKLGKLKKAFAISGNDLDQAALDLYCRNGYFDHHLKRIHREYRKRMQVAMKCARKWINESLVTYTKPLGGYTFWVELSNDQITETKLMNTLRSYNVAVSPGSMFYRGSPKRASFRISIAQCNETQIEIGIKHIADALKELN
jgi:GntR family transcriptional regulator/MocR family aminotransferase